jgi:hypothetical protein
MRGEKGGGIPNSPSPGGGNLDEFKIYRPETTVQCFHNTLCVVEALNCVFRSTSSETFAAQSRRGDMKML